MNEEIPDIEEGDIVVDKNGIASKVHREKPDTVVLAPVTFDYGLLEYSKDKIISDPREERGYILREKFNDGFA